MSAAIDALRNWRRNLEITSGDPVPGDALHGPALDFVIEQIDAILAKHDAAALASTEPSELSFVIEDCDWVYVLRWHDGSRRPAHETEIELWRAFTALRAQPSDGEHAELLEIIKHMLEGRKGARDRARAAIASLDAIRGTP